MLRLSPLHKHRGSFLHLELRTGRLSDPEHFESSQTDRSPKPKAATVAKASLSRENNLSSIPYPTKQYHIRKC
jgi:hypothetical protein